jgi:stage V sporulation protein G
MKFDVLIKEFIMKTGIDITQTKVFPIKNTKTKTRAFAHIVLNSALRLGGLRVIEGENGLFVGYPSEKGRDGNFYQVYNPITRESRMVIQDAILADYEKALAANAA